MLLSLPLLLSISSRSSSLVDTIAAGGYLSVALSTFLLPVIVPELSLDVSDVSEVTFCSSPSNILTDVVGEVVLRTVPFTSALSEYLVFFILAFPF
jgi:hypothetical protein